MIWNPLGSDVFFTPICSGLKSRKSNSFESRLFTWYLTENSSRRSDYLSSAEEYRSLVMFFRSSNIITTWRKNPYVAYQGTRPKITRLNETLTTSTRTALFLSGLRSLVEPFLEVKMEEAECGVVIDRDVLGDQELCPPSAPGTHGHRGIFRRLTPLQEPVMPQVESNSICLGTEWKHVRKKARDEGGLARKSRHNSKSGYVIPTSFNAEQRR